MAEDNAPRNSVPSDDPPSDGTAQDNDPTRASAAPRCDGRVLACGRDRRASAAIRPDPGRRSTDQRSSQGRRPDRDRRTPRGRRRRAAPLVGPGPGPPARPGRSRRWIRLQRVAGGRGGAAPQLRHPRADHAVCVAVAGVDRTRGVAGHARPRHADQPHAHDDPHRGAHHHVRAAAHHDTPDTDPAGRGRDSHRARDELRRGGRPRSTGPASSSSNGSTRSASCPRARSSVRTRRPATWCGPMPGSRSVSRQVPPRQPPPRPAPRPADPDSRALRAPPLRATPSRRS